jgi:DNA-binding NarL/FixJ family response regulator
MSLVVSQKAITKLSGRETEVLRFLLQGFSNRQIANELQICEKTVEKHLTSIFKRLAVQSRVEAALWWERNSRDFPT